MTVIRKKIRLFPNNGDVDDDAIVIAEVLRLLNDVVFGRGIERLDDIVARFSDAFGPSHAAAVQNLAGVTANIARLWQQFNQATASLVEAEERLAEQ